MQTILTMQDIPNDVVSERLYRAMDQDWHGEYLSLVLPCSSMEVAECSSVFNVPSSSADIAQLSDYRIDDEPVVIAHCETIVPMRPVCLEVEECSDCSSIISSLSYQSFDGYTAAEAGTIPADLSVMGDDQGTPMAVFECLDFPPQPLQNKLVSVVSLGGTTQLASDDSMFDGTDMDDDTLSFISSSASSLIGFEALSDLTMSSFVYNPQMIHRNCFIDLPNELVSSIASFLDIQSLSTFRLLSKRSRFIGSKDESGWRRLCQDLWCQKAFVLKEARLLYQSHDAMSAYQLSIYDAQNREELRSEELCFDPRTGEGIVWNFRFKETAGADWTSFDPWWTGGKARKMIFLRDGTIKQIVQSQDSSSFTLYPPFRDLNNKRTQNDADRSISYLEMSWRLVDQPMDLPKRPSGSYLRLTADGRDVPTYVVRRSRTGDWGFVIESCWGVYSSTPLPRRQILNARPPVRRTRMRLRRTRDGARWLNVEGIESDSEDEGDSNNTNQNPNVDSTFSMSTRSQWREALLYNYGAISLPEGEHATAEFDRVWNQSIRQGQNRIPNY